MFKSKIAFKLAAYFAAAILVFALVLGATFTYFFRSHTVENTRKQMQMNARAAAAIMADNLDRWRERASERGIDSSKITLAGANKHMLSYMNSITMYDAWIVDRSGDVMMRNHLLRNGDEPLAVHGVEWSVERPRGPQTRDLPPIVLGQTKMKELPKEVAELVQKAFKGIAGDSQVFEERIREIVVQSAAPIYDNNGGVQGVLVLRVPMVGLRQTWESGIKLFLICSLTALALALLVAFVLSRKFTNPLSRIKETAEKLAERDYTARSYITQKDEIGELANTVDGLATRLEAADLESARADKMRKEFVANVSHELRTPVTVLRGSLEALRDGVVDKPEDVQRYHETMYNETLFLQRLINDLLDLSRLQNVDFPIEKEPLNLCEVVREAARSGRLLARGKQIDIAVDMDTEVYRLTGDFGRLNQMLLIFVDNALKFSPENSTVTLALRDRVLSVTDQGVGIKAEDMPYVFERFYKSSHEQNETGSGLGLAIAREIAQRHGIVVSLLSESGKGTTIDLSLPAPERVTEDKQN